MYTLTEFGVFLMLWALLILLTSWYTVRYDADYLTAITTNPATGERGWVRILFFWTFAPAYYVPIGLWYIVSFVFWAIVVLVCVVLVLLWLTWYDIVSPEVSRKFRDDFDAILGL